MSQIKLVIFDWAGTTVDYGCFAPVQAFLEVFKGHNIEPTLTETREPMGMLKRDHIRTMLEMPRIGQLWKEQKGQEFTVKDVDTLYESFETKLMNILDQFVDIKPGVLDTIEKLRNEGIKIGSTTGYTDMMMEVVIAEAEKNGYKPDFIITPDGTNGKGRPHPDMIYANMKKFDIDNANQVIKVGDTISDIKEGKNAGVFTIGIVEGSSEMGLTKAEYDSLTELEKKGHKEKVKQRYIDAGADAVVDTISGVLSFL